MNKPLIIALPSGKAKSELAANQKGQGALVITVPDTWCYHIHRPAPPGGWTRRIRDDLREGLFPEPTSDLWVDEEIHPDGSWEVWAIPFKRIHSVLGDRATDHKRPVRICPLGRWNSESPMNAFPNLAPPELRLRRWPWKQIRWGVSWGLPPVAALILLGGLWTRQSNALVRIGIEEQQLQNQIKTLQADLAREAALVRYLDPTEKHGALPFIDDLDALTRLIPEDSHAAGLRWEADGIELDLITPRPESIRDALEASPEFHSVRVEGDLDRRGELTRLHLSLRREAKP